MSNFNPYKLWHHLNIITVNFEWLRLQRSTLSHFDNCNKKNYWAQENIKFPQKPASPARADFVKIFPNISVSRKSMNIAWLVEMLCFPPPTPSPNKRISKHLHKPAHYIHTYRYARTAESKKKKKEVKTKSNTEELQKKIINGKTEWLILKPYY